jgi:hypothetical protein
MSEERTPDPVEVLTAALEAAENGEVTDCVVIFQRVTDDGKKHTSTSWASWSQMNVQNLWWLVSWFHGHLGSKHFATKDDNVPRIIQ